MNDFYDMLSEVWGIPRANVESRLSAQGDPADDFTPSQLEIVKTARRRWTAEERIDAKLS